MNKTPTSSRLNPMAPGFFAPNPPSPTRPLKLSLPETSSPHKLLTSYFRIGYYPYCSNHDVAEAQIWPEIKKKIHALTREQLQAVEHRKNLITECLSIESNITEPNKKTLNNAILKRMQEKMFFTLIAKYQEHEDLLERFFMEPDDKQVYLIVHALMAHNPRIFDYCMAQIKKYTQASPERLKQQLCAHNTHQTPALILAIFTSTTIENEEIYFKFTHELDIALLNGLISSEEHQFMLINPVMQNESPLISLLRFGNKNSLDHYFSRLYEALLSAEDILTLLKTPNAQGFSPFNAAISCDRIDNFNAFLNQLEFFKNRSLITLDQIKDMILTPCTRRNYSNFKYAIRSGDYGLFIAFMNYAKEHLNDAEMSQLIHMEPDGEDHVHRPFTEERAGIEDEIDGLKLAYPTCHESPTRLAK